jgi:hypothetical protein
VLSPFTSQQAPGSCGTWFSLLFPHALTAPPFTWPGFQPCMKRREGSSLILCGRYISSRSSLLYRAGLSSTADGSALGGWTALSTGAGVWDDWLSGVVEERRRVKVPFAERPSLRDLVAQVSIYKYGRACARNQQSRGKTRHEGVTRWQAWGEVFVSARPCTTEDGSRCATGSSSGGRRMEASRPQKAGPSSQRATW